MVPHELDCAIEVKYDDILHKCTVISLTRQHTKKTKQQRKKTTSSDWTIQSVVIIDSNGNDETKNSSSSILGKSKKNSRGSKDNTKKKKSKLGTKIDHTTNLDDLHRARSPRKNGRRSALDFDRSAPCDESSVDSNDSIVAMSCVSDRRIYNHGRRSSHRSLGLNGERRSRSFNSYGGSSYASSTIDDDISIATTASLQKRIQSFTLFSSQTNQEFDLGCSRSGRRSLEGLSLNLENRSSHSKSPKHLNRRTSSMSSTQKTKRERALGRRFKIFPVAEQDSINSDIVSENH
mmetsp:Transcript_31304/g.35625  ORF Transcript_31304/g.35625 Transcript_31304/m.35625 type:complete len:291 (-) Transcript_31304:227-1099(-)|eukprot:CAMPEP_0194182614 /NCGR_PEP_ID=MMETSP0154-20130528/25764_1 /TAXON_ID=1049557 /ORGANISM="Thalassiothrix antarctica, Strain L6-D1" /LENGTH=290 /DNA_ID=CAMNT_0038898997 /DNA_START=333 /DNA_END=1205 /DNA_ORIENTATION=-